MTPGTPEAVKRGCTCPVDDNRDTPEGRSWIDANCPLHGLEEENNG